MNFKTLSVNAFNSKLVNFDAFFLGKSWEDVNEMPSILIDSLYRDIDENLLKVWNTVTNDDIDGDVIDVVESIIDALYIDFDNGLTWEEIVSQYENGDVKLIAKDGKVFIVE